MTYEELTAEQQASIDALMAIVRPQAGTLARLLESFQAIVSQYTGNIETILNLIDAAEEIPNQTGLAGAQAMTRADVQTLIGYMTTAAATADGSDGSYNTNYHRSLYAKACGAVNMING